MDIISNTAKLRELMAGTVEVLKNNSDQDYLTKYVKGRAKTEVANKRGFITVLDFEENGSFSFADPNGGSFTTPYKPTFDRITCNYQYIMVGSEITNESLANGQSGAGLVGANVKAQTMEKAAQRMVDMEEYFFCQGDGTQTLARVTAPTTAGTTVTCDGSVDGFGTYFLKKGQVIRIYDSTLVTLKATVTISAKTTNTAVTVGANVTIIAGDLVLPEGDATAPTTVGIKGLPYIVGTATGAYFDKSKTTNPNLAPIVDSTAGALSRSRLEQIDNRHRIRNGYRMDTVDVTSPTQMSQYFALITAQTPTVNWNGTQRPGPDLGLDSWQFSWMGRPIRDFRFLPAASWFKLSLRSLCRVALGDEGVLTPAGDYLQKISGGAYVNAQQRWDAQFVEYFSANPALNAALTQLTITALPSLKSDTRV